MKIINRPVLFALLVSGLSASSSFAQKGQVDEVQYSAVSRQFHTGTGALDIPLPGVECRQPVDGTLHFVVTVSEEVVEVGEAKLTAGSANSVATKKTGSNEVTVDLAGVENGQHVSVSIPITGFDGTYYVPVGADILLGDVNGDKSVNVSDAMLANNYSVTLTGPASFRADADCSGAIDKNDFNAIRANSGMIVP